MKNKVLNLLGISIFFCSLMACGGSGGGGSFSEVIPVDGVSLTRNAAYTGAVSTLDTQNFGACTASVEGQLAFEGTHTVTTGCCGAGEDAIEQLAIFSEVAVDEIRNRFETDGHTWPNPAGFGTDGSRILICANGNADQGGAANGAGMWVVSGDSSAIDQDRTSFYWSNSYEEYRKLVKHEMVHAMHQTIYQNTQSFVFDPCIVSADNLSPNRTIAWFSEGLATWLSAQTVSSASAVISSNRVPALLEINGVESFDEYPLAAAIVKYLLSPVASGGAGNSLVNVVNFIEGCRLDEDATDGPFMADSFANNFLINGQPITYDQFSNDIKTLIENLE